MYHQHVTAWDAEAAKPGCDRRPVLHGNP
jgi:hypothetical protein